MLETSTCTTFYYTSASRLNEYHKIQQSFYVRFNQIQSNVIILINYPNIYNYILDICI